MGVSEWREPTQACSSGTKVPDACSSATDVVPARPSGVARRVARRAHAGHRPEAPSSCGFSSTKASDSRIPGAVSWDVGRSSESRGACLGCQASVCTPVDTTGDGRSGPGSRAGESQTASVQVRVPQPARHLAGTSRWKPISGPGDLVGYRPTSLAGSDEARYTPCSGSTGPGPVSSRLDYVVGSAYSKTMAGIPSTPGTIPVLSAYHAGFGVLVAGSPSKTRRLMGFPSPMIQ
jgi:hypothetical protein